MTVGNLFNGIGGFALAAAWMKWDNIMHCEIDPFCNRVMNHHFPNSFQHEDIRTTDFGIWRGRIDLITGGFPCQEFSYAGLRRGTDGHRYLWPENFRSIKEIGPPWVVCENVAGITTMEDKSGIWKEVFPKVEGRKIVRYTDCDLYEAVFTRQSKMLLASICEDLEGEGYSVQPFIIPAAGVGAPHRRDRIWIVAYAEGKRCKEKREDIERPAQWVTGNGSERLFTDAGSIQWDEEWQKRQQPVAGRQAFSEFNGDAGQGTPADPECVGQPGSGRADHAGCEKENGNWKASWAYDDGRWPTESPVCTGDDGLSAGLVDITFSKWREESLKALGNAIVPQVAYELFKAIEQYEMI